MYFFLIAGAGALRDKLQSRIAAAGLTQHVKLLGFVSDADLPWAYRAADLSRLSRPNLWKVSALSHSSQWLPVLPVLVTPVGGLPEAVSGLNKNLILSGTSASHIAEGLIAALDGKIDPPTEEQCRNYVRANFRLERHRSAGSKCLSPRKPFRCPRLKSIREAGGSPDSETPNGVEDT